MKQFSVMLNNLLPGTLIGILLAVSISCKKKIDTIPKSDYLAYPSASSKDFVSIVSDSGKITLILTTPLVEKYENMEEPYTEFREGINVDFYDGKDYVTGSVTAKYAKFIEKSKLWELKDSVVVLNEKKDKLETELLFWDQEKDLIHTDRFVRITNEDQVVMGTGFESDSKLAKRRIRKVSATIYLKGEE
jgi:LPS export ABC transporter protein LptC